MKLHNKRNRKSRIDISVDNDSEHESVTSGSEFEPSENASSISELESINLPSTESDLNDSDMSSTMLNLKEKSSNKRKKSETHSESDTFLTDDNKIKIKKRSINAVVKKKNENITPNNSIKSDLDISINMNSTGKVLKKKKNKKVKSSKSGTKMYSCLYCLKERKKLNDPNKKVHYAKLVDHYNSAHANEHLIIELNKLPKLRYIKDKPNSTELINRRKILDQLRNEAIFLNNLEAKKVSEFIVSRRPKPGSNNTVGGYGVCFKCKKTLSITSLHKHVKRCTEISFKNRHVVQSSSRATIGDFHEVASEGAIMIISKIKASEILEQIRYDKTIILWLNAEASKHETTPHHHIKIRANLRRLGRLKIEMMKMDETITEFQHIFNERLYEKFIEACKILGKQDPISKVLRSSSTANDMSFLVKNVANIYDVMLGEGHDARRAQIAAFLKKIKALWHSSIGNTIAETQAQNKRNQLVVLPTEDDMTRLRHYLENQMITSYECLQNAYTSESYIALRNSLVSYLHVTNCRRAGEIEKLSLQEFYSAQIYNQDYRIQVRGKRTKPVPIVFHKIIHGYLKLLISYRKDAKINPKNPYIFSNIPDISNEFTFVRACNLMHKFSITCGAKNSKTLRGTLFRKQVATKGMDQGINEQQVENLAGFLGHTPKIHIQSYRQSLMHRDIAMSNLVREAQTSKTSQLPINQLIVGKELESDNNMSHEDLKENNNDADNSSFTVPRIEFTKNPGSKVSWSTEAINMLLEHFPNALSINVPLPKGTDISDFLATTTNKELQSRDEPTVRAWIHAERRRRYQNKDTALPQRNTIPSYIYAQFKKYIDTGKMPSTTTIAKFLARSPSKANTTIRNVQDWIQRAIRRKSA